MEIKQEVLKQIEKKTGKKVTTKSNLKDIGLDSLDMLDQVVEIEGKYDIKIDDNDLFDIKTVQDMINILQQYLDKK